MKIRLLFDENLSPRLVRALSDLFPGSQHVRATGLAPLSDMAIWNFAQLSGFIIVSKDRDFQEFSLDMGHPPKVIAIRTGNCTSSRNSCVHRRSE